MFNNPHDCDKCAAIQDICPLHQRVEKMRADKKAHDEKIKQAVTKPPKPLPTIQPVCRDCGGDHQTNFCTTPDKYHEGTGFDHSCPYCKRRGEPCSRHGGEPTNIHTAKKHKKKMEEQQRMDSPSDNEDVEVPGLEPIDLQKEVSFNGVPIVKPTVLTETPSEQTRSGGADHRIVIRITAPLDKIPVIAEWVAKNAGTIDITPQ